MSTQQAEEESTAVDEIGEDVIVAYLDSHPEFFERHQDLVARLHIPHGNGGTISLVQHQVAVLRTQLDTERRRLAHLVARAREYESLSGRLHGLILQLIAAPDLQRITTVVRDALLREFKAEAVTLKLFPVEGNEAGADPLVSAFREFLGRKHTLCGPLDSERSGALFGEHGEAICSAALVPIRAKGAPGVLAIGSADADRFGAEMGTELLDRLGEIVSQRLAVLHEADA